MTMLEAADPDRVGERAPERTPVNRRARRSASTVFALAAVACSSAPGGPAGSGEPAPAAEALAGPYTAAQAARGEETFEEACSSCHTPSEFSGAGFIRSWSGSPISQLVGLIAQTMPGDDPGSLGRQQYVEVVAYVLALNDIPAGATELPTDAAALARLRIEAPPR